MKLVPLAFAVSLVGTAAFADSTTVTRTEGPLGESTTVRKERSDDMGTRRSVETTGSLGCESKSVTRTNELGDTKTKTKVEC